MRFITTILMFSALAGAAAGQTVSVTVPNLPDYVDPNTGAQTQRVDTLTVTLTPPDGVLTAAAGATTGWGFVVTWSSNVGDYMAFNQTRLTGDSSAIVASVLDLIGGHGGDQGGAMAPGDTWTQPWALNTGGAMQVTLWPNAVSGAQYTGQLEFKFSVMAGQPYLEDFVGSSSVSVDAVLNVAIPPQTQVAQQNISFAPLADRPLNTPPFTLSASSDSSLAVAFSSQTTGVCTVSGNTVTLVAVGSCVIEADQADNASFGMALPSVQSFNVTPALAVISLNQASLTQTWSGAAKTVSYTTSPAGLSASVLYDGTATPPVTSGPHNVQITITDPNYQGSATGTLTINPVQPAITWTTPAAITYGTALSATQLNASANVGGTFRYAPAAGAVMNAGSVSLQVTFTPDDPVNYATVIAGTTLQVNRAPLTITAQPNTKPYDGSTSATAVPTVSDLIGSDTVTGLAETYATATAGTGKTLSVSAYTVNDGHGGANYSVTAVPNTAGVVTKATPVITWAAPAAIGVGTGLSTAQLNAAANVAGRFAYTPAIGAVLNTGNNQTLSVTFTPNDTTDYSTTTATTTINVIPSTAISFATNPPGLVVTVNGTSYAAPYTAYLTQNSTATISVASPQLGAAGTRYAFSSWSDSGAATHTVSVGTTAANYTASFQTQYNLTTGSYPAAGGAVTPATNWYNAGSSVSISATANAGYTFTGFTNGLTGTTNPQNVTMSGPVNVAANFTSGGPVLTAGRSGPLTIPSAGKVQLNLLITNNGTATATNVQITGITVLTGAATVASITPPNPWTIAVGQFPTPVPVVFNWSGAAGSGITIQVNYSAAGGYTGSNTVALTHP